jgi:DivIVA domain-containing protein
LEPDELRYKEFKRSVRGYSPDEVDDLLDTVANELEEARTERTRLTAELDEARSRIEQYESLEGSIRATLTQAEKAASDYQEAARRDAESAMNAAHREAEVVRQEAEATARRTLAASSDKVERVQRSYELLQETRGSFGDDLRSLLEGYLTTLDEANSYAAREIEDPLKRGLDTEAIAAARTAADQEHQEERQEELDHESSEAESLKEPEAGPGQEPGTTSGENEASGSEAGTPEDGEPHSTGTSKESSEDEDQGDETGSLNGEPRRGRFLRRRG